MVRLPREFRLRGRAVRPGPTTTPSRGNGERGKKNARVQLFVLQCAQNNTRLARTMKIASEAKPRLVVYLSGAELKAAKSKARTDGLRTPHQWLGVLLRRELAKGNK